MQGYKIVGHNCGRDAGGAFRCACQKCKAQTESEPMRSKRLTKVADILLQSIEQLHAKSQRSGSSADYNSMVELARALCAVYEADEL